MTDTGAIEKPDECREKFEAYKLSKNYHPTWMDYNEKGKYSAAAINSDWELWQAAWQARTETVGGDQLEAITKAVKHGCNSLNKNFGNFTHEYGDWDRIADYITNCVMNALRTRPAGNAMDVGEKDE